MHKKREREELKLQFVRLLLLLLSLLSQYILLFLNFSCATEEESQKFARFMSSICLNQRGEKKVKVSIIEDDELFNYFCAALESKSSNCCLFD
jgi:hypothetical protein